MTFNKYDEPIVTVILTVFRRTVFLKEAILSVLNQKFKFFEIIVTDDSNSPEVREIIKSFNSDVIRYRCNSNQLGVVTNIKIALNEAKGKFVAILNDDDIWESTFLSDLVKVLNIYPNAVIAFSDHWIISESGVIEYDKTEINSLHYGRKFLNSGVVKNPIDFTLNNGIPLAMACLIRIEYLKPSYFIKNVTGAYDFWLSLQLVALGKEIIYVPKRLTRYREHYSMETNRKAKDKNLNLVFIYEKLLKMNFYKSKIFFIEQKLCKAKYQVGKDLLFFNQADRARIYLFDSLNMRFSLKTLIILCLTFTPLIKFNSFCRNFYKNLLT